MRKTIVLTTLLFLFLQINNFSQERIGIHKIESERYKSESLEKIQNVEPSVEIIPLNKNADSDLSKSVFGFLPYWEYSTSKDYLRYELLTHIAAFSFSVTSSGSITNPSYWPWTDVINEAHENGVKVVMSVINFSLTYNEMHNLLTDSTLTANFINAAKAKIETYSLDGINIDFEGSNIDTDDRGSVMNAFMQELTDSIHAMSPDLEVSFASPAINWSGWDFRGLANSCDYLFVMGYDFYGSWSDVTGPTAPLVSNTVNNVTNTIDQEYFHPTYYPLYPIDPSKIILGVPYYGPHWTTQGTNEQAQTDSYVTAERFKNAQPQSEIYGIKWSNTFQNSWFSYTDGTVDHQVWFDNDSSLGLKYDLAISRDLKGVGMWALGYDGARTELWNLINRKFGTGETPVPAVPTDLNITILDNSEFEINFSHSDYAESYEIYMSSDAATYEFLKEINTNTTQIGNVELNKPYYFKVRAKNTSGTSFFTEVLGGMISTNNKILIVNGFDRTQSTNNTFDFIRQYSEPLKSFNYGYSSSTNEAIIKDLVDLNDFSIVIWMLLDESSTDDTFNQIEQESIKVFLQRGGSLFVSGAEIGWDLVAKGSSSDIEFYNKFLKADYIDDAPKGESGSYYKAEGISGQIFEDLNSVEFDNGTHGTIDVDWPDAIKENDGSVNILKYVDVSISSGGAGVAYSGVFESGFSEGKIIHLAIPFETIYNEDDRTALMGDVLEYFDDAVSVEDNIMVESEIELFQNYPNPFNPSTVISYKIPYSFDAINTAETQVTLKIYDVLGREIATLVDKNQSPGNYKVTFDGSNITSGTYFYRLRVGENVISKKMSLIK